MLLEKVIVQPHVFQFGPRFDVVVRGIKIIDARSFQRQHKGRMSSNDKLATVETRRLLEQVHQFQLELGRQAVLGFIQQVEATILDGIFEVLKRRLSIRALQLAFPGVFLQELRALFLDDLVLLPPSQKEVENIVAGNDALLAGILPARPSSRPWSVQVQART